MILFATPTRNGKDYYAAAHGAFRFSATNWKNSIKCLLGDISCNSVPL